MSQPSAIDLLVKALTAVPEYDNPLNPLYEVLGQQQPARSGPTELGMSKGPSNERDQLYHAPCPNVHTTGGICQGNTPFPICSVRNIQTALKLFLEGSLFNADLSRSKCQSHPEDVRQLWAELDGRKRFPLSELVPARMQLGHLL